MACVVFGSLQSTSQTMFGCSVKVCWLRSACFMLWSSLHIHRCSCCCYYHGFCALVRQARPYTNGITGWRTKNPRLHTLHSSCSHSTYNSVTTVAVCSVKYQATGPSDVFLPIFESHFSSYSKTKFTKQKKERSQHTISIVDVRFNVKASIQARSVRDYLWPYALRLTMNRNANLWLILIRSKSFWKHFYLEFVDYSSPLNLCSARKILRNQ